MKSHDVSDIFKYLQILDLEGRALRGIILIGFFQLERSLKISRLNFARYRRGMVAEERNGTSFPQTSISRFIISARLLYSVSCSAGI